MILNEQRRRWKIIPKKKFGPQSLQEMRSPKGKKTLLLNIYLTFFNSHQHYNSCNL